MDPNITNTFKEIMSQPEVWASALDGFFGIESKIMSFWEANPVDRLVFTGCGSTYYLANVASELFQALLGLPCQARPASEVVLFPDLVIPKQQRCLLVAISRSGETTETVDAVRTFQARGNGRVIGITCDSVSELSKHTDLTLAIDAAQELSVAQTRSFSSMAILLQALAGLLAGFNVRAGMANISEALDLVFERYHGLAKTLGESQEIDRFFFLGSGYLHGIAQEAMLKIKEMSLSYSEAFHTLEFRHGPMSMVTDHSLITGLISPKAAYYELSVLGQMKKLGGQILVISESDIPKLYGASGHVHLHADGFAAWSRPILYLPILQLMALYRAIKNGQNPDQPENLNAVVELKSFLSM